MAIVINGSGTITGISVGGLPDGIVDSGTLATDSVDSAELINGAIDSGHLASGVGGTASATDCEAGSRDISIANSTQSFTAFGQQPDLVDIMFVVGGSVRAMCWAKVNANGSDFGVHMNASNADSVAQQWSQTGTAYPLITSSGNQTECQPTITSTGIDLAFTKTGSPTGTCNILITYMKFA